MSYPIDDLAVSGQSYFCGIAGLVLIRCCRSRLFSLQLYSMRSVNLHVLE